MFPIPIDVQVKQIVNNVLQNESPSSREIAVALEANQRYIDYLDWLKDNIPPQDESIVIEVNGMRIKFQNTDDFSNWLSEQLI